MAKSKVPVWTKAMREAAAERMRVRNAAKREASNERDVQRACATVLAMDRDVRAAELLYTEAVKQLAALVKRMG